MTEPINRDGLSQMTNSPAALPTLAELCASPNDFLESLDVGAVNLICSVGLPGAEKLETAPYFDWLERAARQVDFETRRHWYRFLDSPATYNNSPGYFCCYFLLQVLQEDFDVRYNPARVRDPSFQDPKSIQPDFRDSRDLFIHGIIDGPGGTCASMPVIYVAVGRKLGYPLKLVETKSHLFFRWDDPRGERLGVPDVFNVDGAGYGIASHPDDYYRNWPERWTEAEENADLYLKSMSPAQELAAFLCTRAECLIDNERLQEAIQAYKWALGLSPKDRRYGMRLYGLVMRQAEARRRQRQQDLQYILQQGGAQIGYSRSPIAPGRQAPQPRHGSSCQCFDCKQARAAAHPRAPHGDYCQCNSCRQVRASAQGTGLPGHPTNCACFGCQQQRSHRTLGFGPGRFPY